MKCHDCNLEAKWIVEDQPPYEEYFLPLCEEHFQEIMQMEGEMNLTFDLIDNLDLEDMIIKANKQNRFWQKRYENLLKEYSGLKKKDSPFSTK